LIGCVLSKNFLFLAGC